MSDITKCSSTNCPQRDMCHRAQVHDNEYAQSWLNFEYTCNENSGFEDYIPILNKKKD